MNVPDGRADRYRGYFQQMLCAQKKVDALIAAIPPSLRQDAIIIVQGDHGSRISLVDPTTVAKVEPSASDYADMRIARSVDTARFSSIAFCLREAEPVKTNAPSTPHACRSARTCS